MHSVFTLRHVGKSMVSCKCSSKRVIDHGQREIQGVRNSLHAPQGTQTQDREGQQKFR